MKADDFDDRRGDRLYPDRLGVGGCTTRRLAIANEHETLKDYGRLVGELRTLPIEIIPLAGAGLALDRRQPSGDQGGVDRRTFRPPILVEGRDALRAQQRGRRRLPCSPGASGQSRPRPTARPNRGSGRWSWRANYHPRWRPAVLPALRREPSRRAASRSPSDDVTPERFTAFPVRRQDRALRNQPYYGLARRRGRPTRRPRRAARPAKAASIARVSVDFAKEFRLLSSARCAGRRNTNVIPGRCAAASPEPCTRTLLSCFRDALLLLRPPGMLMGSGPDRFAPPRNDNRRGGGLTLQPHHPRASEYASKGFANPRRSCR